MLAIIAAAAAAPGAALAAAPMVPIDKAFPYLSAYLRVPAAERSRFYLVYRAYRNKKPVSDAKATIIAADGARTPVGFDRQGIVTGLPNLAFLKTDAHMEIDSAPFQMGPEMRCALAPSTHVNVADLALALAQVNQAVVKLVGALSLVAPKFTAAYFPDAGGAQAVMADGRTMPLPVFAFPAIGTVSYIEPATLVGAKSVAFVRPPSRILLGGHPKT
ncbi:MAG TPA: hypothetical protein VGI95_19350 [Caulobacteraceae bacterium]|jgi:hypothetical protein